MKQPNKSKKTGRKRNVQKTLKMNCHPNNTKRISEDTCYTPSVLMQIREAYNKTHVHQITSNKPKTIYKQLRSKLDHCEKEDCWMETIKDPVVKYELDKLLFAPDSPHEWKKNPNEWLSNYDIRDVLKQYEMSHPHFKLLGPSSIDYDTILQDGKCVWQDICRLELQDLLKRGKRKMGIVFNLDKHYEPGSHWVSVFVDCDEKFILYYDSAVNNTPKEIKRLIGEIAQQGKELDTPIDFEVIENKHRHQTTNSECGMYSLFFIITLLTSKLDKPIYQEIYGGGRTKKLTRQEKIKIFTEKGLNDSMMKLYRSIYFNLPI